MTFARLGPSEWPYSIAELWADGVVHGLGVAFVVSGSIAFLVVMGGNVAVGEFAAACVYLATLFLSLGASALYNVWPVSRTKWLLRRFDHSAIYLLIAGTYTPPMVWIGSLGVLAFVWATAIAGIALKLLRPGQFDRFAIGLYLALGWSGFVLYDNLVEHLPGRVLAMILIGGVLYSLGVIFHVWERLKFQNVIWHSFVLAAAVIHFIGVWWLTGAATAAAP